jgi:glycosyltransferase involved in cell wall biosynthesis/tRNA A-37 threonylcarbamoyl transferase component Bud32
VIARRAIAVMVSRFPLVTETFILRELIELERRGQPVLLVPMLKETPRVVHDEAKPWVGRAFYTPYVSVAIAAANLRALRRRPVRYLGLLAQLVGGSLRSPGVLARTLAIFPKSVYLAEELRAQGIRHIHAHFATHPATMAMIVSELTGIGFSITAHAHDIFVDRTLLGMKLRRAKFVRTISKFNRGFLADLYPEAASKIEVIHVGVDLRNYDAAPHPASSPALLLCVAAFKPYKGLPVLIDACARLASAGVDFRCEIIGDGPQRRQLEELIGMKMLNERVRLLGNLPQHEVAERMRGTTVLVLPSVVAPDGQMEGIPVALMEAMAAQRPVVASALSGIPELVDHERTGLLVEPGNAAALAEAIRQILADRDRAAEMGRRGRERVREQFVLSSTVAQLLEAFDAVNEPPNLTKDEVRLLELVATGTVGVRRIRERQDSRVVEISADGRELIVKTQISRAGESRPPVDRARHEYEILGRLASRGAAPRPVRLEGATIVMERAEGMPLDRLIRELRQTPDALVPAFRAVGRWLREFQAAIPNAQHGDMWPGNIFISGDRVQVIDFEGLRNGEEDRDVANFLAESRKFFSRPNHRRGFLMLRTAFLEAYSGVERG